MKQYNISHEYNIDLWDEGVCDQGDTPRDWIYAPLNPIRQKVARKLRLKQKNFQLSGGYLYFYAMYERSATFLDTMIAMRDMPLSDGTLTDLLREPLDERGQWCDFAAVADKYGLVPLFVMPDVGCHHRSDVMFLLNNRLRLGAMQLRKDGDSTARKAEIMEDIRAILCANLGTPPQTFNFLYTDTDEKRHLLETITPLQFYREYCGTVLTDYVTLIHHPSARYPVHQKYNEETSPEKQSCFHSMLSVELAELKAAVVRQLQDGEQVVIGADVRFQSSQMLGILDLSLFENDSVFGRDIAMCKADKLAYKLIAARHMMSIDGVHLSDNGAPVRFKVQDSHGAATGADGHYTMSAAWFDEYVLNAVVKKKYLPEQLQERLELPAVYMPRSERF
ncbi:MAG: hypothetical protein IJ766_04710 [Clostridia bacterium]|nr:hypothetical protein [Clostridia bacterium]